MTIKKWDEITRGSKIHLSTNKTLKGMNNETRDLKAGNYYINGFWADICGLSKEKNGKNDVCIKATELVAFDNII